MTTRRKCHNLAMVLIIIGMALNAVLVVGEDEKDEKDPVLDEYLARKEEEDRWKSYVTTTVDIVTALLSVNPAWNSNAFDAVAKVTATVLEVDSDELKAVNGLKRLVQRQFEKIAGSLEDIKADVQAAAAFSKYNSKIEEPLLLLKNGFKNIKMGTPHQIPQSRAFLVICENNSPYEIIQSMENFMGNCFPEEDDNGKNRHKRFVNTTSSGRDNVQPEHEEMFDENRRDRRLVHNGLCLLELAYKKGKSRTQSLYSIVDNIREHMRLLVFYGKTCAVIKSKTNTVVGEEQNGGVPEVVSRINEKMLKWIDERFELAWKEDMRETAKSKIEKYTQAKSIPASRFKELAKLVQEAMHSMSPIGYAYQVVVFGASEYLKWVCMGKGTQFTVSNVKKVDVLVTRHQFSDEKHAKHMNALAKSKSNELQIVANKMVHERQLVSDVPVPKLYDIGQFHNSVHISIVAPTITSHTSTAVKDGSAYNFAEFNYGKENKHFQVMVKHGINKKNAKEFAAMQLAIQPCGSDAQCPASFHVHGKKETFRKKALPYTASASILLLF